MGWWKLGQINIEETMIPTYRKQVDSLLIRSRMATENADRERKALDKVKEEMGCVMEAQGIVQGIAQSLQQRAHDGIASVVTRCLQVVFDNPYEFRIRFDQKRGKTEAVMVFVRDGHEYDDPFNDVSGGVIDVAALALRLVCIALSRPPARRLLVLDEPFCNVRGLSNRQRVRRMLLELAEKLEFQIILNIDVDVYPEFRIGKVVELGGE